MPIAIKMGYSKLESSSSYGFGVLGPDVFLFFSVFSCISSGSSFSSVLSSGIFNGGNFGISANIFNMSVSSDIRYNTLCNEKNIGLSKHSEKVNMVKRSETENTLLCGVFQTNISTKA